MPHVELRLSVVIVSAALRDAQKYFRAWTRLLLKRAGEVKSSTGSTDAFLFYSSKYSSLCDRSMYFCVKETSV